MRDLRAIANGNPTCLIAGIEGGDELREGESRGAGGAIGQCGAITASRSRVQATRGFPGSGNPAD
jgi:hypothetical protein